MLEPYSLLRIVRNSSNCEFSCEYLKFSLKNNLNGIQAPPEIHLTHRLDNWYLEYFTILLSSNPTYKDYHFLSYRFNLMVSAYQRFQLLILHSYQSPVPFFHLYLSYAAHRWTVSRSISPGVHISDRFRLTILIIHYFGGVMYNVTSATFFSLLTVAYWPTSYLFLMIAYFKFTFR